MNHINACGMVLSVAAAGIALSYFLRYQWHDEATSPSKTRLITAQVSKVSVPSGKSFADVPSESIAQAEIQPVTRDALPKSFTSVGDMWAYANSALNSSNESRVYEGHWAARECTGFSRAWLDYSSFAGGGKSNIQGPLTPARQVAIQALQQRCNGFILAGNSASRRLVDALESRMNLLGGKLAEASKNAGKKFGDDTVLGTLLFSESPTAIEEGLLALSKYRDAEAAGKLNGERLKLFNAASLAAICDLGKDCGIGSYHSQLLCALGDDCSGEFWQKWSDGLDASEVEQAKILRQRIVDAVHGRDLPVLKGIE